MNIHVINNMNMNINMKKILWISNYGYQNSFALVTQKLIRTYIDTYPDNYEWYLFAIGITHSNDFPAKASNELRIPESNIYFLSLNSNLNSNFLSSSSNDDKEYLQNYLWGVIDIDRVIDRINPDIIISLCDLEAQKLQYEVIKRLLPHILYIPYVVIDYDIGSVPYFPIIITPSQHSYDMYSNSIRYLLPHIAEIDEYDDFEKENFEKKDKFVILCCNANHVRKRLDLVINTFEKFAKDKDDVYLIIKTNYPTNTGDQYDFSKYKNDKVSIIYDFLNDKDLVKLYKNATVGLSCTSGEGFGLTPCEMGWFGIVQIIPDNTSHSWIFGNDYIGLIRETTLLPVSQARSSIRDVFLLKSYKHWTYELKYVQSLQPSNGVVIINYKDIISNPLKYVNIDRYQVICSIDEINNINMNNLISNCSKNNRKIIAVQNSDGDKFVHLPNIDAAVKLLNMFYYDRRTILSKHSSEIKTNIRSRFNKKNIVKLMNEILNFVFLI